jgi:uncharacterized membrane protein
MSDTKIGLAENISGVVAYVLGFITGIILLVIEKENKFVRFHAAQSTIVTIALIIIYITYMIISFILALIPVVGWIIGIVLGLVVFIGPIILWIFLMFKAYKGEMYRLPMLAEYADKLETMF